MIGCAAFARKHVACHTGFLIIITFPKVLIQDLQLLVNPLSTMLRTWLRDVALLDHLPLMFATEVVSDTELLYMTPLQHSTPSSNIVQSHR